MMNERIKEFAEKAEKFADVFCESIGDDDRNHWSDAFNDRFAELIVKECAEICMEMSAKCAGLPGDGSLAKDCAYWIKKDFGVDK